MSTKVINLKNAVGHYVRIDRQSEFGNPYTHLPIGKTTARYSVKTREESIECYKRWVLKDKNRLDQILTLKGETLACHCHPLPCHGDVIAMFADNGVVDVGKAGLSNFTPVQMTTSFEGRQFTVSTLEHAYQGAKATCLHDFLYVTNQPTPGKSRRAGREIKKSESFDRDRVFIMRALLKKKFENKAQAEILLKTGSAYLVENTMWHDNYWGTCLCPQCKEVLGENVLGELLMEIRQMLTPLEGLESQQIDWLDSFIAYPPF